MAEDFAGEKEGSNLGDSGLQESIARWAEVLDRWVKGIDKGLGREPQTDGQSPHVDGRHGDPGDDAREIER